MPDVTAFLCQSIVNIVVMDNNIVCSCISHHITKPFIAKANISQFRICRFYFTINVVKIQPILNITVKNIKYLHALLGHLM